jgi:hypothetical protein
MASAKETQQAIDKEREFQGKLQKTAKELYELGMRIAKGKGDRAFVFVGFTRDDLGGEESFSPVYAVVKREGGNAFAIMPDPEAHLYVFGGKKLSTAAPLRTFAGDEHGGPAFRFVVHWGGNLGDVYYDRQEKGKIVHKNLEKKEKSIAAGGVYLHEEKYGTSGDAFYTADKYAVGTVEILRALVGSGSFGAEEQLDRVIAGMKVAGKK